jgi:hypothetical protein
MLKDGVGEALLNVADLNKERLDKLDEIGFEFDVAKKTLPWQTRFEQMLEFKEKNGHCNVPRHYKENPSLGTWYCIHLHVRVCFHIGCHLMFVHCCH